MTESERKTIKSALRLMQKLLIDDAQIADEDLRYAQIIEKTRQKKAAARRAQNLDNLTKGKNISAFAEKGEAMAVLNIKGLVLGKKRRKDGRYMGRWLVDGQYKAFYAKSYEALEAKASDIVRGKKKLDKPSLMTCKDWAEKWLNLYHKQNVTEDVYKKDCATFKNHVYPHLGNKLMCRLSGNDLQETINLCPFSRQRQLVSNLIVACIRTAYETDVLKKDITKSVKKPRHEKKDGRPLSRAEEKQLLEALKGHELESYIILLLNSGLRRNEALGLQWKYLDFHRNEITVDQQVNMKNQIIKRLKTKTSRRVVKMFPAIKKHFEPLAGNPESRLFEFYPEYVSKNFGDVCKKLELTNYSIKGNRTTFATRCAENGIADKVVQAWLGHAKLDTTVNVYQKTTDEFIEQEFNKILTQKPDTDL